MFRNGQDRSLQSKTLGTALTPNSYFLTPNLPFLRYYGQHRTIPALRLKHRSGSCGTASALPKCSIKSGCGTRIVLRGQKPLALCDRCPCFGSLFPPLAALTFAASSIICAFGLTAAAPRSPYRHLELCGIALEILYKNTLNFFETKFLKPPFFFYYNSNIMKISSHYFAISRRKKSFSLVYSLHRAIW